MKNILVFSVFSFLLLSFTAPVDLYGISIKTLEGKPLSLSSFKGKKILFILTPLRAQDSTMIANLDLFQKKFREHITVIGVPSIEDGFKKGEEMKLKKMYQDRHADLLLTEGMQVKKGATQEQAVLFQWLTNKELNKHFNMESRGVGHKFFVDESGKLYAVLGPEIALDHPVMERIVRK